MTIVDLKAHPVADWKQAIVNHYAFPPYWWIRGVSAESRQALMNRELDEALTIEKAYIAGYVSDEGDLLGFVQMRWMEWDTSHFGVEIWRLDHLGVWSDLGQRRTVAEALARAVVQSVCERGGETIQTRVAIDNLPAIHALEGAGFRTVEVLTTWLFDFARSSLPAKRQPEMARDFVPTDTEELIELARAVYTPIPDRFHVDPHLSSRASDLYAEWIRNSCSGKLADHIAVAESDGRVIGYATMKYHGDHDGLCNARIGQLGLGAMMPEFRNRGLVSDLVIHNLEWLDRHQADYVYVGTQGNNIPPQRLWLRVGFKPATTALALHFWAG